MINEGGSSPIYINQMQNQDPYQYHQEPQPQPQEEYFPSTIPKIGTNPNQDSLDNNCDAKSDKNMDDIDNILGDNYERNNNQMLSEVNLLEVPNQAKKEEELFQQIATTLHERNNIAKYEQVLKGIIINFQRIHTDKVVKLVAMVMEVKSSNMIEMSYFARAILFLKQVWTKLSQIQNMTPYSALLNVILQISHPFYSIGFTEDVTQILQIYLVNQNREVVDEQALQQNFLFRKTTFDFNYDNINIIESMLNDHFLDGGEVVQSGNIDFYMFVYKNFFESCIRKTILCFNTNVLLISQAPNIEIQEKYLEQNEQGLFIEDFSNYDKKDIEGYAATISQIATVNQKYANKYIFRLLDWLLGDNSQMEKKIIGFKILGDLVGLARSKKQFAVCLINWLSSHQVLEKFLRQSTHSRILQHLSPILHFLYEHNILQNQYLNDLMKASLHSQDLFKIIQTMLSWLKIDHLEQAFDLLCLQKQKQASSLQSQFINALVSSPILLGSNSKKRKNVVVLQDNRRQLDGEMEVEPHQHQLSQKAEFLVKRLMKYLIERAIADQQLFMPILLKHITAHVKLLKPQLQKEIINLLKSNSPAGVWILEQCLKVETSHDQGQGQGKYELISRLASEGVYELILALIARHRYSRSVVDKSLSVVILFCRFHKALQRSTTEFLWKVLGLTASDEREREQFFVFLKQIVRFEGAVSEESVNFIFFDLFMALCADWFSLRVYDCLEMLFLRLNQDCKLISFQKDHYKIIQPPLIGTDKLWYIYFNCPDLKVTKRCKDFIFKLIMNSPDKQQQLYQEALSNITKYLQASLQLSQQLQNKQQILILRGFQISEKLLLERQRVEQVPHVISLKIMDTTPDSFQKTKNLEFNQKLTLADLKYYIAENLNPTRKFTEIELLNKGKVLVGQNQTLKQMKLQSNETITVALVNSDVQPLSKTQKQQLKKDYLKELQSLFGEQFPKGLLQFIVDKFEGDSLQNIANIMFDPTRIDQIKLEYQQSKEEAKENQDIFQKEEVPKKFGQMLVQTMSSTQLLLKCLMVSHNKKGGWKLIKQLPVNKEYLEMVQNHIQTGDWVSLFKNKTHQESKYIAYILTHIIKQSTLQSDTIFNDKKLRAFLIQWIFQVVQNSISKLEDYENIFKLLLISLSCPLFAQVQTFVSNKKNAENANQLPQKLSNMMQIESMVTININEQICFKLIQALIASNLSQKMALTIIKLYLYQLYYFNHQERAYSLLYHPQLHWLLLKYGKPIYFAIIAASIKLQANLHLAKTFNLSTFTSNLLLSFLKVNEGKEPQLQYSAYFACIQSLLGLAQIQNSQEQLLALSKILSHLKQNISILLEEQIIGYMRVALKLLDRHLSSVGKELTDELLQFADWLFNLYLFGIHISLPYFKNKGIRKISYQLIHTLCAFFSINRHIVSCIKKLMNDCKGLEKEDGEFRTNQFVGMKNLGATCYINSLIQQLYHTSFPKLLLEEDTDDKNDTIKLMELKKLFANLYIGVKSPVSTNKYVETVKINGEQIRPLVQQDVNQYFASLMHEIEQSVGNKFINDIMSGSYSHQIRGLEEGAEVKNVEETYLTLMIQMRGKKNLSQALSALSKQHILQGQNMYYSQVLHKKIRASSKTYLDKLPPLLVITLKRFYWNFETMTRHKINDYFQFPAELDLSRYAIPGKKQVEHYYEYKICGILIHSGSAQSGHYYSFIKVGQKWLEFNDRHVSEWDFQNNLKNQCFGGNEEKNRNAYMLFYERVESQVHGASLHLLSQNNRLINLIKNENQSFIKNRLIYDSGYIDFIKELSKTEGNSHLLKFLDDLNIKREYEPKSYIDVDNLTEDVEPANKDKFQLAKKLQQYGDKIFPEKQNEGDIDNYLSLVGPNEKGTQNDKL